MTNKIKCPFCGEDISKSDKICPICAEELPNKEEKKIDNTDDISDNLRVNLDIANLFKNHLEFLGYNTELDYAKSGNDNVFIYSKHEKNSNLTINIIRNDLILLSSRYTIEEIKSNKKILKTYEITNKINSDSFITKWVYLKDDEGLSSINIEVFISKYEKSSFIKTLNFMEEEIKLNIDKFIDIEE